MATRDKGTALTLSVTETTTDTDRDNAIGDKYQRCINIETCLRHCANASVTNSIVDFIETHLRFAIIGCRFGVFTKASVFITSYGVIFVSCIRLFKR